MEPATVIGSNAIEGRGIAGHVMRVPLGVVSRLGTRVPRLIGPALAKVDPWLVERGMAPSAKLMLWRRLQAYPRGL